MSSPETEQPLTSAEWAFVRDMANARYLRYADPAVLLLANKCSTQYLLTLQKERRGT